MEPVKRLGRGLEEISNQLLTKHEEKAPSGFQHELEQLNNRLEKLEQLTEEKQLYRYNNTAEKKPPQPSRQYYKYDNIIKHFQTNMARDYIACGVIDLSGLPLCFHSNDEILDEQAISAYLTEYLLNTKEIADKTALGTVLHSMLTTQHYHLFLQNLSKDENCFLCLLIRQGGNIGLAKFLLTRQEF